MLFNRDRALEWHADFIFLYRKFVNRWVWFLLRFKWTLEPRSRYPLLESCLSKTQIPSTIFFLVHNPNLRDNFHSRNTNVDEALYEWLKSTFPDSKVVLTNNLNEMFDAELSRSEVSSAIVVTAPTWIQRELRDKGWLSFWLTLLMIQKSKLPIWMAPLDPCDLNYLIKCSVIARNTKGLIISCPHSGEELHRYGVPNALGPILWILTRPVHTSPFYNETPLNARKRIAVLAGSGGGISRTILMDKLAIKLSEKSYEICTTKGQFTWVEYIDLVRNSSIVATSSWLQEEHKRRMWMHKDVIPSTVLTHRVLEGFLSGALVITNRCQALTSLGFKPGIHFLEVAENYQLVNEEILSDQDSVSMIARSGQEHLRNILMESDLKHFGICSKE